MISEAGLRWGHLWGSLVTQDVHAGWQVKKTVLYLGGRLGSGRSTGGSARWGGWGAVGWGVGQSSSVTPTVWALGEDVIRRNVSITTTGWNT